MQSVKSRIADRPQTAESENGVPDASGTGSRMLPVSPSVEGCATRRFLPQ
ncbi:hypothetical protein SynPROS71_01051 [Synechococcus sp. PROS-7-1]|nr:hypothetical protein SynPROS71_01051 [Synechococcus sp. PROS-7-1]